MATIKSPYTLNQFKEALQKKAYALILEAVQNLMELDKPKQEYDYSVPSTLLKASGSRIDEISTDDITIKFTYGQISIWVKEPRDKNKDRYRPSINFGIEEKLYANSNHSSKITFPHDRNDVEGIKKEEKKIMAFLNEVMKGIEPEQRFSLKKMAE